MSQSEEDEGAQVIWRTQEPSNESESFPLRNTNVFFCFLLLFLSSDQVQETMVPSSIFFFFFFFFFYISLRHLLKFSLLPPVLL